MVGGAIRGRWGVKSKPCFHTYSPNLSVESIAILVSLMYICNTILEMCSVSTNGERASPAQHS